MKPSCFSQKKWMRQNQEKRPKSLKQEPKSIMQKELAPGKGFSGEIKPPFEPLRRKAPLANSSQPLTQP